MSLIDLLPFGLALLLAGALSGTLAGLLGAGGGIVIVPVLYLMFPFLDVADSVRMPLAVGTSLAVILPTGLMSARAHWRRGGLDPAIVGRLGPWVALGVVIGAFVGLRADSEVLTGIFGVVALLVALNLGAAPRGWRLRRDLPGRWGSAPLGLTIGGLSVVMGVGGGGIGVPILTACGVDMRRAVGSAASFGPIIALPGAIAFAWGGWGDPALPPFSLGYVSLAGVALIIPASMAFANLGAWLAHRADPHRLRQIFALFLAVAAIRMLLSL